MALFARPQTIAFESTASDMCPRLRAGTTAEASWLTEHDPTYRHISSLRSAYLARLAQLARLPANYLLRRTNRTEYRMRNGVRLSTNRHTDGHHCCCLRPSRVRADRAVQDDRRHRGARRQLRRVRGAGLPRGAHLLLRARMRELCHASGEHPHQRPRRRVSTIQYAVASTSGPRDLVLRDSLQNTFHMAPLNGNRQTVRCTTLRDIFRAHDLDTIDLLKINCEGSEYEILEGCSDEEFGRIAHIRLEYHNLDAAKHNGKSLSSLLERRGFTIERFTNYRNTSGFIWAARPTSASSRRRGLPQISAVKRKAGECPAGASFPEAWSA